MLDRESLLHYKSETVTKEIITRSQVYKATNVDNK